MKGQSSFPLRRDLGSQLLFLYLAFVGLFVLVAILFVFFAQQRLKDDVSAANLALAQAIAQETNTAMGNTLLTVRQLADYPAVQTAVSTKMSPIFQAVMAGRDDINLTYRLDGQGIMLFHYPVGPESTVGKDFSFRDYFQRAALTHDPLVSQGRISPTTNEPVATAVMPLWNAADQFIGLVGTNLKLQFLSDTLTSIAQQYGEEAQFRLFIIDHAGQTIGHSDPDQLLEDAHILLPAVTTAVLDEQSGTIISDDPAGQPHLYSYVPIPDVGWGVIVEQPTAVAFATIRAFQRGLAISIIVLLVLGILFWLTLSRRVIRPLERLAYFSQEIALGDDLSVDHHRVALATLIERPDQMGLLTRGLTQMQQAIEMRFDEVDTLLDTSAAVVSTLDQETVLNRILEQTERLLAVSMSAIFALDEQQGIFRVYASHGLPDWYTEKATVRPDEPSSVTMRAIHSGEPIQISDTETNPSFKRHRERARMAGYQSVLAVPLAAQYTSPAALLVFRPDSHVFSHREISLLTSFVNHATMAIENAALYAHSDMRLKEETRRLQALIQSMQDGLVLEDLEGRVLYANRSMAEWSGLPLAETTGVSVDVLMAGLLTHAHDRPAVEAQIAHMVNESGDRHIQFLLDFPEFPRYLRLILFDVTDPDGTPIGRGRIVHDITQRYEVDRMKSSLISTVSHELRTPLAAIKGYASTLLADDVEWDEESKQEFLGIISDEADHLSQLVTDLLDMSRIEAGNVNVQQMACVLSELIEQAQQYAHPSPGEYLHVDLPPALPTLFVDPQRMVVVLRNLIENAVKYGGEEKPIWITAVVNPDQVIVKVRDQGPGIPQTQTQQAFDSFHRIDSGLTRQTTGAGLGLAISRGFVRAHGGNIWIEPTEEGLCVAFSIPL